MSEAVRFFPVHRCLVWELVEATGATVTSVDAGDLDGTDAYVADLNVSRICASSRVAYRERSFSCWRAQHKSQCVLSTVMCQVSEVYICRV